MRRWTVNYNYLSWVITFNPKPIPVRTHDYDAVHPDYDGCDGGNGLYVTGESVDDCKKQIDELIQEEHAG